MRTRAGLIVIILCSLGLFCPVACAAPGDLDQTFGGRAFTAAIGSSTDFCYAVAIQADGKFVLAGLSFGANDDFALARYTTNGVLDTSFGTNSSGKVTTPIGSSADRGRGVAIQSNGMIVVAGEIWNGADWDFALARYTTTGTLDTAFGTNGNGFVTTDISSNDYPKAVVIQADGMIVVAGNSWTTSKYDFALARYDINGALDTNFGPNANGKITTGVDAYNNVGNAIALASDGKIMVVGYGGWSGGGTYEDFALARYTTNGALDTSFSGDGKLIQDISGTRDYAMAVAIQPDGKIVTAGYDYNGNDLTIARFNSSGPLDTSFSGDGKDSPPFVTNAPNNSAFGYGVALQADGKIVMVGSCLGPYDLDFVMLRYATNGALDASFGTGGRVMLPVGTGADYARSVALQTDGKIVVAGYSDIGTNYDFALARYDSAGNLDFKNGKVTTDIYDADRIYAVVIQADGKIVGAGYGVSAGDYDFALARYATNGDLDLSFSTNDGRVLTAINSGTEYVTAILIQSDGKALAGGITVYYSTPATNRFALVRYTTNGALDSSWGSGGKVQTSFTNNDAVCRGLAQQPDGKIIAAGYAKNAAGNEDFALARYLTNGTLDTSFGANGDGTVLTPIGSSNEYGTGVALQSDGKIVVAGYAWISGANSNDFALARYTTNGVLDATFGTNGGIVTTPIGTNDDIAYAVVIQSDGKIIAAGSSWQGANSNDFALARYNGNGTLDTGFGTNGTGKVVTPVLSSNDVCRAVALATRAASRWPAESVIVAAGYALNNTNYDVAVVRYKSDGTLDTRFGNGGKVTVPIGNSSDYGFSAAIQSDGKIVVAGSGVMGDEDFAVIRLENEIALPAGTLFAVH